MGEPVYPLSYPFLAQEVAELALVSWHRNYVAQCPEIGLSVSVVFDLDHAAGNVTSVCTCLELEFKLMCSVSLLIVFC
ncbi:hypothetical protein COLO4_06459 [Corchorus olitorius]|uniref:Uncharacterized protein n=1 Tax=Corchorus olitorius TaxID=93759 RepID=A0A1R3KMY7_9ROSI|nr:hypothetical protein COLO4_06459 [Corchorus olitorius]